MSTLLECMMTPVIGGAHIKHGEEVLFTDGTPAKVERISDDHGVFCMPAGGNIGSWKCATELYRM